MKLRNKQTGKIAKLIEFSETGLILRYEETGRLVFVGSFTKTGEEWEDAPEDSGYWYYDTFNKNIDFEFYPTNTDDEKADREIVGLPFDEFKDYLLNTWEKNYGEAWAGEPYHIDHIIPLVTANNLAEIECLCHYTNLQMLKPEDNLKKGRRINE